MVPRTAVLLACACRASPAPPAEGEVDSDLPADEATCGPDQILDTGTDAVCPIHACARDCDDVTEAIACCIESEGYGLAADQYGWVNPECPLDPDGVISFDAAICAAQVQGLPQLGDLCWARFGNRDNGVCQLNWQVFSYAPSDIDKTHCRDGWEFNIDAVTGAVTTSAGFRMCS